jgi:hypothetical protein
MADRIVFEEFNESLNALVNGGAAGPSDVTANMVKAWSEKTRRLVYLHMENIWTAMRGPPPYGSKTRSSSLPQR